MADPEVIERLDTIIALMNFAFSDEIERARSQFMNDPVSAAILDSLAMGPVSAGDLKEHAAKASGQSERTVLRRIASLVAQRAIAQQGSGPRTTYRTTGLF